MKIPELDELAKTGKHKNEWTEDEDDTVRRYYKKVSPKELIKYLNNRTEPALRQRVIILQREGRWRDE